MIQSFFSLFHHILHLPQKELFFPRVQIALALVLCASCGEELKSICSWVLIPTSKPTIRCLASCFLQLPVGSQVPLLAQVSALLFQHTLCCALLLQHGADLGDSRAISGTLQRSSLFHWTCDWGQERQACSNPTPSKLVNANLTSHSIHYTPALSLVNIFLLWGAYGLENAWHV